MTALQPFASFAAIQASLRSLALAVTPSTENSRLWTGIHWKLLVAACAGALVIAASYRGIFGVAGRRRLDAQPGMKAPAPLSMMAFHDPEVVGLVIAFDAVLFLVIGWVFMVAASWKWETASLAAGACLMGGGLAGLLFGMPLAADSSASTVATKQIAAETAVKKAQDVAKAAARKADDLVEQRPGAAAEQPPPPTQEHVVAAQVEADKARGAAARAQSQTLLSQSASTLSKVLAGAGLVKGPQLLQFFRRASEELSRYIDGSAASVLGGAIIAYFGLLGFLAGLFLPAYFMKGWQDLPPDAGKANPTPADPAQEDPALAA